MKQELLDAALAATDALIADELGSKDNGRYVRISKLCVQADKLRQMAITRVADVDPAYIGAVPDHLALDQEVIDLDQRQRNQDFVGGVNLANHLRPVRDNPMGDMMRLVSEQLDKMREDKAASTRLEPRTTGDIAHEVEQLLHTRALVTGRERLDIIDRRVDQLLKTIDKETANDPAADDSNVVPSLVLRGHPPRGDGQEDLRPSDIEGNASRERRAEGAAQDGRGEVVGHGG